MAQHTLVFATLAFIVAGLPLGVLVGAWRTGRSIGAALRQEVVDPWVRWRCLRCERYLKKHDAWPRPRSSFL